MPQKVEISDLRRLVIESAGISEVADSSADIMDTRFTELGCDSLTIAEIASRITSEYGISINDDALDDATTPRLLLDLVNGR